MGDFLDKNFFGATPIPYSDITAISKDSPEIIVWAAPFMFLFVLIEWYFAKREHKELYQKAETIGSVLVGIGNVIIAFGLKFGLFYLVTAIYNTVPWRMQFSWWSLIPCYILLDLCSYWSHRISHEQRIWWATHVVHHSSEHYNLSVSFRLSWVQHAKIIFFLPVAFSGFHPVIFFIANQIAVLFQFWVHTEYIRKLPAVFEYIFATPSNHRVHHGRQDKYINKNYGATFIVWDRLFGTYQPEEEQVEYGITHNIDEKSKSNPLYINFHEFADIWRDFKAARSLRKMFFVVFGNPIAIGKAKKLEEEEKVTPRNYNTDQKVLLKTSGKYVG